MTERAAFLCFAKTQLISANEITDATTALSPQYCWVS
jgi:hypothetical protein